MTRVVELDYVNPTHTHRALRKWASMSRQPVQMTLFPATQPNIIMTIVLSRDASPFKSIVSDMLPQIMFDIRTSPRFDYNGMNRRDAFAFFSDMKIRYFDLSASFNHAFPSKSRMHPTELGLYIRSKCTNIDTSPPRMALLIDDQYDDPEYISQLVYHISPAVEDWNWMRVSPANAA